MRAGATGVGVSSAAALVAACGSSGSTGSTSSTTGGSGKPTNGGTLHIGIGGGGPTDSFDPQHPIDGPSQTYSSATFNQLTQVNEQMQLTNQLAEEVTPSSGATEWTIRLRDGVEWHNGKTFDADDVIYSFQRMFNPKNLGSSTWIGAFVQSMKKMDARTVKVTMKGPMGWFDLALGDGGATGMVPVGFDLKKPVGTGPFKFVSYSPGEQAVLEKFPNYWGGPVHLDRVVVQTINDDDARLNALLTGQIDVSATILPSQAPQISSNSNYVLYNSPQSGMAPFTMRVDKAPFNDVRVRQALRLCIDRKQVVNQAASGYGTVGNDLFSPFDPDFDHSLVREQDNEQAKSLLKQAGQSDLNVQLTIAQLFPGQVQAAEVVVQNAAAIGVKINLNQVDAATLFGPNYLSWPFAMDIYPGLRWLTTSALGTSPYASINETHFSQPQYDSLWKQASATLDASKRHQYLQDMQQILFNQGGYIIPMFPNAMAALSKKVGGYPTQDKRGYGPIGTDFSRLYISA